LNKTVQIQLTLIRGLPGSGKSTLARNLDAIHLEADQFFIQKNGVYLFKPLKLKAAHKWCQNQCEYHLKQGNNVVVSNTFVKRWELEPYLNFAKQYNANLIIKTCTEKYSSIHDVSEKTIQKMSESWEEINL
jgi:predicted kinase